MVRPIGEHFAVAIEQAVQAVQRQVPQRVPGSHGIATYPAGFEPRTMAKGVNLRTHQIISLSPRCRQRT
ncbi:hypothetical protein KCP78_04280 [Salmonella enterica subsp. enterica]|nr:hypothetical protein KCP78_04280 [Salmonella enterica subsp. enterica]